MRTDYSGITTEHLTAVRYIETRETHVYWEFLCDCGKTIITRASCVLRGEVESCGHHALIKPRDTYTTDTPYYRAYNNSHYASGGMLFSSYLELAKQDCYYCGAVPALTNPLGKTFEIYSKNGKHRSNKLRYDRYWIEINGIDKKTPTDNYNDISNLVACCRTCNWMKGELTEEKFRDQVIQIGKQLGSI